MRTISLTMPRTSPLNKTLLVFSCALTACGAPLSSGGAAPDAAETDVPVATPERPLAPDVSASTTPDVAPDTIARDGGADRDTRAEAGVPFDVVDVARPEDRPVPLDVRPDVPAARGWTLRAHPCPGTNRTDALHVDDEGTLWVGCGSGAEGAGLFRGSSDGATWGQLRDSSAGVLSAFRVSSIERGYDGALYVGGYHSGTRTMALRVDTRATPPTVESILVGVPRLGSNFHVGTLRVRRDGTALAESLTGADLLWRPASATGATGWTDVRETWSTDGAVRQMLDLVTLGDRFVGCGSTIASSPYVFLPVTAAGAAPYRMTPLVLSSTWTGELWGVTASAARVVAVGVDQRNSRGKILVSGADPHQLAGWRETSLDAVLGTTRRTWARGVCMRGDRIVAVGEHGNTGIVVESTDGGDTWRDITPTGVSGTVSKCVIRADGTLVVAGSAGMVGFYR